MLFAVAIVHGPVRCEANDEHRLSEKVQIACVPNSRKRPIVDEPPGPGISNPQRLIPFPTKKGSNLHWSREQHRPLRGHSYSQKSRRRNASYGRRYSQCKRCVDESQYSQAQCRNHTLNISITELRFLDTYASSRKCWVGQYGEMLM